MKDVKETGLGSMEWIDLAQNRDYTNAPFNKVMGFQILE
jgi:hypothetical protein